MNNLPASAARSVIVAVILISPVFGSLMIIAAEMLIDLLMEVGATAVCGVAGGAAAWVLVSRMSPHAERAPQSGPEQMSDEAAIAAPPG